MPRRMHKTVSEDLATSKNSRPGGSNESDSDYQCKYLLQKWMFHLELIFIYNSIKVSGDRRLDKNTFFKYEANKFQV